MSDQIVAWMERVSGRLDAQETMLDLLRQEVRAATGVAESAGKALETIAGAEERRLAQATADAKFGVGPTTDHRSLTQSKTQGSSFYAFNATIEPASGGTGKVVIEPKLLKCIR